MNLRPKKTVRRSAFFVNLALKIQWHISKRSVFSAIFAYWGNGYIFLPHFSLYDCCCSTVQRKARFISICFNCEP